MRFGERAAEDGEILAEGENQTAGDGAIAGDHPIAGDLLAFHAEILAAMLDKHVPLFERAGVEEKLEPLARGELALAMLCLDPPLAAPGARQRPLFLELPQYVLHH